MDHESATKILCQIEASSLGDLVEEVRLYAVRYAGIRAEWLLMDREERCEKSPARSRAHDALIDAINILSREMGKGDEDNSWRQELSDDRKEIGDFACHLHAILGIRAR